ncbi:hypothetical protein CMUS01_00131 [Colletotrichum musicola]|uniref:Uncharacterized protein n=1 Tax=Colletotrichum musicola TaxID=2175873 RepID=A0A8H6NZR9_9PEZI|nr:hypothetical protein CMUS01_00131 [Colletotrichum musicola]
MDTKLSFDAALTVKYGTAEASRAEWVVVGSIWKSLRTRIPAHAEQLRTRTRTRPVAQQQQQQQQQQQAGYSPSPPSWQPRILLSRVGVWGHKRVRPSWHMELCCAALGFCRDDRRFPARFGFNESGGGERAEADGIHQSNSATPARLFAPPSDPPYSAQSQTERRAGWNATAHGDAQRPEMIEAAGGRGSGKESCDNVGSSRAFRVQCADFGSALPRA